MNRNRRLLLVVTVVALLVAAASALAWRSAAAPAAQAPLPGGPGFLTLDPAAFHPRDVDTSWSYYDGWQLACPGDPVHPMPCWFVAAPPLPNNVTITKLVVVYYDNSEGELRDLRVKLWRHNPATGGSVEMASVESWGAVPQYRYGVDESITEPVVDQQQYTYSLEAGIPVQPEEYLRLTGVRIDYAYGVTLPLVTKDE